jgi:hypothetical protein
MVLCFLHIKPCLQTWYNLCWSWSQKTYASRLWTSILEHEYERVENNVKHELKKNNFWFFSGNDQDAKNVCYDFQKMKIRES